MTETVDAGKRKELQRMRRAKLMSLIASHVVPQDLDFLNEIDAMYSTAKDTTEDDDEDEIIMGDFVDELVLDDLLAEDKQEFRMVSDAVKKRRIRRVQQTWQAIKKSQQAKAEAKAKAIAKAKAKAKAKGKAKGKFGRQRMLPRKRPRAPDENGQEVRVPGRPAEVPDGQEGAEGRVPAPPADVPEVPAMPVPAAPPEVPVVPVPAQEERVVVPRGPQHHRQPNRVDFRGVWQDVQCPQCPKVAGQMKYDPNPGGKDKAEWILRVRVTDGGFSARCSVLLGFGF